MFFVLWGFAIFEPLQAKYGSKNYQQVPRDAGIPEFLNKVAHRSYNARSLLGKLQKYLSLKLAVKGTARDWHSVKNLWNCTMAKLGADPSKKWEP